MRNLANIFLKSLEEGSEESQVARGSAGTFSLKVGSRGLSFVTAVILGRLLGAEGYGAYSWAIATVGLLLICSLAGFERLIVRELAVYRATGQWGLFRGLLRRAATVTGSLSIGLALLTAVLLLFLRPVLEPTMAAALLLALPILPLITLMGVKQSVLQGLRRVATGHLPGLLVLPLLLLTLVVLLPLLTGRPLTTQLAVGSHLAAAAAALAVALVLVRPVIPGEVRTAEPVYQTSQWIRAALPLLLVSSMIMLNQRIDILMLGAIGGAGQTGIYTAANRGAELVSFIIKSINPVLSPLIAALYARGEIERLQRIVTKSARVILLLTVPIAIAMILFGRWFLLLFGPEFADGTTALTILTVGHLFSAAIGSVGMLLIMSGHDRDAALTFAGCGVLNIILNALFIPRWGLNGAAIATTISLVTWNVILTLVLSRRMGIAAHAFRRLGNRKE